MLKSLFFEVCKKHAAGNCNIESLWEEIEKAYSNKKRHYHNLSHLQNLAAQLLPIKDKIKNWDAVMFATFYHDIVYNVLKNDNEEKSGKLAFKRLSTLGCRAATINICESIILATKKHELNTDSDVNYFIDADLSVLGASWNNYKEYSDNVRKEYAVFPDILYKPGRRKVLEHFLSMNQIFKTPYFLNSLERHAKDNLKKELELLS